MLTIPVHSSLNTFIKEYTNWTHELMNSWIKYWTLTTTLFVFCIIFTLFGIPCLSAWFPFSIFASAYRATILTGTKPLGRCPSFFSIAGPLGRGPQHLGWRKGCLGCTLGKGVTWKKAKFYVQIYWVMSVLFWFCFLAI